MIQINEAGESARRTALVAAEGRALTMLDAIEGAGLIRAGRTEQEVEQDIKVLAARSFGIRRHWHKRIVRCGPNTLATAGENPPVRTIAEDDIVFLDIGPVMGEWEADVGRSYAIGDDPAKHALCRDLAVVFDQATARFQAEPDITGAELYRFACEAAARAGWRFGGEIAGHIVAEFPHARIPGPKEERVIAPGNDRRMRDLDGRGRARHWILEIHLVSADDAFGGFYERLLLAM